MVFKMRRLFLTPMFARNEISKVKLAESFIKYAGRMIYKPIQPVQEKMFTICKVSNNREQQQRNLFSAMCVTINVRCSRWNLLRWSSFSGSGDWNSRDVSMAGVCLKSV
jgi:hypothetical protein